MQESLAGCFAVVIMALVIVLAIMLTGWAFGAGLKLAGF